MNRLASAINDLHPFPVRWKPKIHHVFLSISFRILRSEYLMPIALPGEEGNQTPGQGSVVDEMFLMY